MIIRSRRRRGDQKNNDETPVPDVSMQWRRMIAYLSPYKFRLVMALLATLFSAALGLVFPWVIQQVVDTVLERADLRLLNQITIALLFVFFFRSITSLVETYNLNYIGERLLVDLRTQLYAHLHAMSLAFFTERRVGELVSRISSDVTIMRSVLTNNINTLLQQTFTTMGAVMVMVWLNWRLTLFIIGLVPVVILVGFGFGFYLRRISTQVQDEVAESTVVAEESFQGIREVKSFVRESYETERYNDVVLRAFAAALRLLRIRSIFGPLMGFLVFSGLALILWFGGREVLAERLSGGELIAFLIYGLTVAGSFASLVGLYTQFQEAIGATKRVFQLLDTESNVQDSPSAVEMNQVEGSIRFDNVTFAYDDRVNVLQNIQLDVAPGEIIALVGPSGAGKSTLFNLIPRFYDPVEGTIAVDGYDLKKVTKASLRKHIGIVPQDTLLFGGTIRENILYGRLDASEDEMMKAARDANAHEFIMQLPDQYETIVGERGVKLSGGQRQRIAIARAILKNPRILLLDEATSSLDSESEHLVQDALTRLMADRTTIIIAHRLSTTRVADRIAVIDKGHIVELGMHDELMTARGLYARLYEMQFDEVITPKQPA